MQEKKSEKINVGIEMICCMVEIISFKLYQYLKK